MWVGPFWFGMLFCPEHELTQKAMQGPWFFLGPILMWWLVTLADPQGLIELTKDSTDPTTILDGLAHSWEPLLEQQQLGRTWLRRHFRDKVDVEPMYGRESIPEDYGTNRVFRNHVDASWSRTIHGLHSFGANQLNDD